MMLCPLPSVADVFFGQVRLLIQWAEVDAMGPESTAERLSGALQIQTPLHHGHSDLLSLGGFQHLLIGFLCLLENARGDGCRSPMRGFLDMFFENMLGDGVRGTPGGLSDFLDSIPISVHGAH